MAGIVPSAIVLVLGSLLSASAQTTSVDAFDAISIKPNRSLSGHRSIDSSSARYSATNTDLAILIMRAYNIASPMQLEGMPDWTKTERFDIEARRSEESVAQLQKLNREQQAQASREQLRHMLVERFSLLVHEEQKEIPGYALVQVKSGSKLAPLNDDGKHGGISRVGTEITGTSANMARLCGELLSTEELAGPPIMDSTGLTNRYNFTLKWTEQGDASLSSSAVGLEGSGPSLFTALQEQLGLKLEPRKVLSRVIVVDRLDHPAEN